MTPPNIEGLDIGDSQYSPVVKSRSLNGNQPLQRKYSPIIRTGGMTKIAITAMYESAAAKNSGWINELRETQNVDRWLCQIMKPMTYIPNVTKKVNVPASQVKADGSLLPSRS